MTEVFVSQSPQGYTFTRLFSRGRIVLGGEGAFNRVQLRAVADVLGVPANEPVEFLDLGTYDVLYTLA